MSAPSMMKKDRPVLWLALRNLEIAWVQSQRALKERKVRQIAEEFDPDAVGIITVAELNGDRDGQFHIIDGQHRVAALRLIMDDHQKVPCEVIRGCDTPAEAAAIWLKRNANHSAPSALEKFERQVVAEELEATAINGIVIMCGFHIGKDPKNGIRAIRAIVRIYRRHGEGGLRWVLKQAKDTWGLKAKSVQAPLLDGFSAFYGRFHQVVDTERLASRIGKKYTPDNMIGSARGGKEMFAGSMAEACMRLMVTTYNGGRLAEHKRLKLGSINE